jgi:hypothetical protein
MGDEDLGMERAITVEYERISEFCVILRRMNSINGGRLQLRPKIAIEGGCLDPKLLPNIETHLTWKFI